MANRTPLKRLMFEDVPTYEEVPRNLMATVYIPLDKLVLWDSNPKRHHIGAIMESIRRHGFKDPSYVDRAKGCVTTGNGRAEVLKLLWMEDYESAPRGIYAADDGQWWVPIQVGVDSPSPEAAEAYAIDHNNSTLLGGDFSIRDLVRMYDHDDLRSIALKLVASGEKMVTLDEDDVEAITMFTEDEKSPDWGGKRSAATVKRCPACGYEFGDV